MKNSSASHYYLPGLDGLRAIAVLAVVIYHLGISYFPGGFLGVDVFFVISGFLITSLLLVELEKENKINFKAFYLRRARRLLPALFAVLFFCGFVAVFIAPDTISSFKRDFFPAMFYFSNWGYIFFKQSYFEFIGRPPLLQHLWSLAIEEQFYLVWPSLAIVLWRFKKSKAILASAFLGVLFSTSLMIYLAILKQAPLPNDPSRIYFGTDTHSMGIFTGIFLAVVFRPWKKRTRNNIFSEVCSWALGALSLIMLFWFFLNQGEYSVFLYRGGFLVVSIISALAIFSVSFSSSFGRALSVFPLKYLGKRSYGVYLWHWPIFLLLRPGIDISQTGFDAVLIQVFLLLVVSELSYRFIEMPVRNGAIDQVVYWFYSFDHKPKVLANIMLLITFLFVSSFLGLKVATMPTEKEIDMAKELGLPETDGSGLRFGAEEEVNSKEPDFQNMVCKPEAKVQLATIVDFSGNSCLGEGSSIGKEKIRVSAIGDLVILGASPAMGRGDFDLTTYAVVSQSPQNSVNRALELHRSGKLADVVIVHTGNNGPITEKMLVSLLDGLQDRKRVIVVNNKERRSWEGPNNELYAKLVSLYPNARLMDWREYSIDHPEYFYRDGIHVNPTGAKKYAELASRLARYPDEKDFRLKIVRELNPFSKKKKAVEKTILSSVSSFEK